MQTFLRAINIILSPVLTLYFSYRFGDLKIAGQDGGDVIAGAVAALLVLIIEIVLSEGPKHSVWLRRWLEPRAVFEGVWVQEVLEGRRDNAIGLFSFDYQREGDTFAVVGHAYSDNGQTWAKWTSTHMFIDKARLKATYRWEGELLDGRTTPDFEKSGLTDVELRAAPTLSLPMTGEGRVLHVGESSRLRFRLRRATNQLLKELGLPFGVRQLRINAHDEEAHLIKAVLKHREPHVEANQLAAQG